VLHSVEFVDFEESNWYPFCESRTLGSRLSINFNIGGVLLPRARTGRFVSQVFVVPGRLDYLVIAADVVLEKLQAVRT